MFFISCGIDTKEKFVGKGRIGWPNGPDIRPFCWVGQRHPLKNAKTPALKIIFQNFVFALKFEQKSKYNVVLGGNSTDFSICAGDVPELSRRCPGDVPEMSRRCPGVVPEMSRRCPGDVPEMSRRCPGDVPEDSWMSPTCGLFQIPKIRVFFVFSWFWSNFFVFVFCVVFFAGFVRFGTEKFVEFNSVCKIPFVLFAVQSVPSIFCFTVVLRCFTCLCFSLPPWE